MIFRSDRVKGGVLTNVFAHLKKSNAFANNRAMSKEELIRLNKHTQKLKAEFKTKNN